jgi:hypothetical protein
VLEQALEVEEVSEVAGAVRVLPLQPLLVDTQARLDALETREKAGL